MTTVVEHELEQETMQQPKESEYTVPERKTIFVDFDGVLNSYVSGWVEADVIPDPPVEGAIAFLHEAVLEFEVVIFTTRARYPEAELAIRRWLREHGYIGPELAVTHEKGPAIFILDDRGWRFRGVFPTMQQIRRAYPWRVGDPLPGERFRAKAQRERRTIASLESVLGRRKAELRQLKAAAQAVVDYYSFGEMIPEVLENLRAFLPRKES